MRFIDDWRRIARPMHKVHIALFAIGSFVAGILAYLILYLVFGGELRYWLLGGLLIGTVNATVGSAILFAAKAFDEYQRENEVESTGQDTPQF